MNNMLPYNRQWSTSTPGLLIFLVDQSSSMKSPYNQQLSRAEYTAKVLNLIIGEIIARNVGEEQYRDRAIIKVIGYGHQTKTLVGGTISSLAKDRKNYPIEVVPITTKRGTNTKKMQIFIKPTSEGYTPMLDAFIRAEEFIKEFCNRKPNSPAPVLINITDGHPEIDGKATKQYMEEIVQYIDNHLKGLQTHDGALSIFNIHIASEGNPIGFVAQRDELGDFYEQFLFDISTIVPNNYKKNAGDLSNDFPHLKNPNVRGFIANADAITLVKFLNFGSNLSR